MGYCEIYGWLLHRTLCKEKANLKQQNKRFNGY